ncbi:MAG: cell division protein ZapA [Burkholderiales bacterium]|nr:MAG: cell division protein ZapA [Burkholderiales bacterium]
MSAAQTKQLEVQIMGQSYLLSCPVGGEAALLDAVERVDTAMCRIRDAGKVRARDRIAVLASLNLAFELAQKEREGTAPSPALAAPAVAQPADPAEQARLNELLQRLDQVLGDDGQLI